MPEVTCGTSFYLKVYRLILTAQVARWSIAVRLFIFWSIHYLSLNTQKEYRAGTLFLLNMKEIHRKNSYCNRQNNCDVAPFFVSEKSDEFS